MHATLVAAWLIASWARLSDRYGSQTSDHSHHCRQAAQDGPPLAEAAGAPHKGRPYEPVYGLLVVVLVDRVESLLDLLIGPCLAAVESLGVEAEQDSDAVAGSACDLCRGDAGLKPE